MQLEDDEMLKQDSTGLWVVVKRKDETPAVEEPAPEPAPQVAEKRKYNKRK